MRSSSLVRRLAAALVLVFAFLITGDPEPTSAAVTTVSLDKTSYVVIGNTPASATLTVRTGSGYTSATVEIYGLSSATPIGPVSAAPAPTCLEHSSSVDGRLRFTIEAFGAGTCSFTFQIAPDGTGFPFGRILAEVNDGLIRTAQAPVEFVQPLVANSSTFDVPYDMPFTGQASIEGGKSPFTFTATSQPAPGAVTFATGANFTFTPDTGQTGTTSFTYSVSDAVGQTATGTVTLNIAPPPVITTTFDADEYVVHGNTSTSVTLTVTVVTANPGGPDGIGSIAAYDGVAFGTPVSAPPGGIGCQVSGTSNTSIGFTFDAGTAGTCTITFPIVRGSLPLPFGTIEVSTQVGSLTPSGDSASVTFEPPLRADDATYNVEYDTPLTETAPVVAGTAPYTCAVESPPAAGSVTFDTGCTFTFTPATAQTGTVSFTYRATDSSPTPQSDTGTITITIALPPAVVASDGTLAVPYEGSAPGSFNATGGSPPLEFSVVTPPTKGTVALLPGSNSFFYTAAPGQTGTDTFTYRATDPELSGTPGMSDDGTITITIGAAPTPTPTMTPEPTATTTPSPTVTPTSTPEPTSTAEPSPTVTPTETPPDNVALTFHGDPRFPVTGSVALGTPGLTYTLIDAPGSGAIALLPDGTFTYQAMSQSVTWDQFVVRASDGTTITVTLVLVVDPSVPTYGTVERGPTGNGGPPVDVRDPGNTAPEDEDPDGDGTDDQPSEAR